MFDAISVPFGAKMLFNTVKLKPGVTFEQVELTVGEMCSVVKETYGGDPFPLRRSQGAAGEEEISLRARNTKAIPATYISTP